jgi:hypothetical protein
MDGDINRGTGKYRGTGIGVDVECFYYCNINGQHVQDSVIRIQARFFFGKIVIGAWYLSMSSR